MILSALDLADICGELYQTLDGWDQLWTQDAWGLTAALRQVSDRDVIVHRGSATLLDWYRDATSEISCDPPDPQLGEVPAGFFAPMRAFHEASLPIIRPGPCVVGHSLGAARAVIHAALLAASGKPPVAVLAWGCPRPGTQTMNAMLAPVPYAVWFGNAGDPVPDAPITVPILLPWIHCGAEIKIAEPGAADDLWGPLRDHRFELYRAGTAKLDPMPVMLP
jgi:hypothetical protein